jgi:hypothetical protein
VRPGPPIIDVTTNRICRGLDPSVLPALQAGNTNLQDRVEVVQFSAPGSYLVICGVLPHFVNDNMFGYVKVVE